MKRGVFIAGLLILFLSACSSLNFSWQKGSIQPDSSVEKAFTQGTMKPDFKYYFLSAPDSPYVIIAVDGNLTLDNADAWRRWEPGMNLGSTVQYMYDRWRMEGYSLRGYRMLDQNKRYVGDWYSIWDINIINPILYSKDETHIIVYPPPFPRLEPTAGGGLGGSDNK